MQPHWYETIWCWVGIWGFIALGIWRIYRNQIAFRDLNAAASDLQLQALQAQMNPHFVGNSINAIQQFFYPPNPEKASEYIALFTRLLRQTMVFSEQRFIKFQAEIQYDQDYLKMVQLRFGTRFQYLVTGAEGIPPETPFPSMILQPLLENATIHGLAEEGVSILKLDFSLNDKLLRISLCDNGPGIEETLRRKKDNPNPERQSKGTELLIKKIQTINRLYGITMKIDFQDLRATGNGSTGTCVVISFLPDEIRNQNKLVL
jgi:LytS/YehU family sensor histidine kinase